jgi:hypothetical protein
VDLPEYSPDAGAFFINEMAWALREYPHSLPFNATVFLDTDRDAVANILGMSDGESARDTRYGRLGFSLGTILPIPFVPWLSIAGHFTGTIDGSSFTNEDTGKIFGGGVNTQSYLSGGFIGDFKPLTLGLFVGYAAGSYSYWNEAGESIDENSEKPFKIMMVPILKTKAIPGLSFLEYIANFINFGNFKPEEISFGQNYVFSALKPGGHSLKFDLHYSNGRYSSMARNWVFGLETEYDFGKERGAYVSLDGGYQYFYDTPPGISHLKNLPFFKGKLGFDFSRETTYTGRDGTEKQEMDERGFWFTSGWDFQGFSLGLGGVIKGFQLGVEILPYSVAYSAFLVRVATRLYIPGRQ